MRNLVTAVNNKGREITLRDQTFPLSGTPLQLEYISTAVPKLFGLRTLFPVNIFHEAPECLANTKDINFRHKPLLCQETCN